METLLSISFALLAGLMMTRIIKRWQLPAVTAYLVAGVLILPNSLGLLHIPGIGFSSFEEVSDLSLICDVALGFIAFAIGNEFRLTSLKQTGKQATVIAVVQAIAATIFVDVTLLLLHLALGDKLPVSTCIVLGAVATATAPAATIMVVNQYKAKGPLTKLLLPIVALDDAVGLIVFAVSFGVAKTMISGSFSLMTVVLNPLLEIVCSLALGAALGALFSFVEKLFQSNSKRLSVAVTFVILAAALSKIQIPLGGNVVIEFSSLLVCMMVGTVFCNVCDFSEEIMFKTDRWTAPLYVLFFVLSGAELDLRVFAELAVVGIGAAYIISRSAGKIAGASVSSKLMKCDQKVCQYLGLTLLPQAGVALGMSVTVAAQMGAEGAIIRDIILFSVLIYELIGPILTKYALSKAGEIQPKPAQRDMTRVHAR